MVVGYRLVRMVLRILSWVLLAVVVYVGITAYQVWHTSTLYEPHPADAIIVMGAAQYDGTPTNVLAARLDEAAILWRQHLVPRIVVTGGRKPGDTYTEAEASALYLEARGIPRSAILEAGGNNSWENIDDAVALLAPYGAHTVLMVTDPFHEMRSMAIASSLGLAPSPTPTHTSPITGWQTVPYFAKETVGVAVGRIVGFHNVPGLPWTFGLVP